MLTPIHLLKRMLGLLPVRLNVLDMYPCNRVHKVLGMVYDTMGEAMVL